MAQSRVWVVQKNLHVAETYSGTLIKITYFLLNRAQS